MVNSPFIDKTGESKGLAFRVTPEKVHQKLMKLNGKILSTWKKNPKHLNQKRQPNFEEIISQKTKTYSSDPDMYMATTCMRKSLVSVKSAMDV